MRATPANRKTAAEDNYLCGSFLVRPNTFLNQKSSYLCVLVETAGIEPASENRSAGLSSGVSGLLISPGVAKPAKLFRSSPFIRGGYKDELTAHVHCLMTLIPEPQYSPDERAELKSASLPFRQQLIQC